MISAVISHPRDVKLLSLARDFVRIDAELLEMDHTAPTDANQQAVMVRWQSLAAQVARIRARTEAGRAAKSRILQSVARLTAPSPGLFRDLALSLARDLAR